MAFYHQHCTVRLINSLQQQPLEFFQQDAKLYFNSIHGTMAHLLGGEEIWMERLSGCPTPDVISTIVPIYSLEPPKAIGLAWEGRSPNQEQLFHQLMQMCAAWIELLEDKDDDWCLSKAKYNDTKGVEMELVRASGLSQVFNHGTHHRGQVSAAYAQFGKAAECPSFDLQSMEEKFQDYASK